MDLPMQAILEFQKIVMHLTEKVNESSNLLYYMHHVCCKKCQRSWQSIRMKIEDHVSNIQIGFAKLYVFPVK